MLQSSPATARRSDSSSTAIDFNSWLNHARAGRDLPPSTIAAGKGDFNSWLSRAWDAIAPLPEASDLTLIKSDGKPRVAVTFQTVVTVLGLQFPICLHDSLNYRVPESEKRVGDFFGWAQSQVRYKKRRLKQKVNKLSIRLSQLVIDYPGLLATDIENAIEALKKPLSGERFVSLSGQVVVQFN
jgi:hypothetical protein